MASNQTTPHPSLIPQLYDTNDSAAFICFQPSTLKLSRVTGTLAGVPAPVFKKLGRKVVYERRVLEEWLAQFDDKPNTAAVGGGE